MRLVSLILLLLLLVQTAAGQQFVIQNAEPQPGATGVALSDTVAFAFNRQVSIGTDFNTEFLYEPRRALNFNTVELCLTFLSRCDAGDDIPRFVRFITSHEPDTDYTWLVYAVTSSGGQSMTEPYVLRYTTAARAGEGAVAGTVQSPVPPPPASTTRASMNTRATLRHLTEALEAGGRGRAVFSADTTAFSPPSEATAPTQSAFGTVARPKSGGPYTQILLVDEFSIDESDWSIRGADVLIGSSGSYAIEFVRAGTYVPIAVRYTDGTNQEIDALGFYDADRDGTPDAVDVSGGDLSGIDLQLFEFPLTTAGASTNLAVARDSAAQYAPDQALKLIEGANGARTAGTAYAWRYVFHAPSADLETAVVVDPLGVQVDTTRGAPEFLVAMSTIPEAFADTDAALQEVLDGGGQDFVDGFRLENVTTRITGGNQYWTDSPDPQEEFWRIRIIGVTSSRFEIYESYIGMETGTFLPVELAGFTAAADGDAAALRWTTVSETGNAGFEVQHAAGREAASALDWQTLGFVDGAGTTTESQAYRFRTDPLDPGTHRFRLRQLDTDGTAHLSDVVTVQIQMDAALRLTPPAPHPVRQSATLQFGVRDAQPATVTVVDMLGRQVATLYDGTPSADELHTVQLDASRLPSGLYVVRLQSAAYTATQKVLVVN